MSEGREHRLNSAAWDVVLASMVQSASGLLSRGELRPPITVTLSDGEAVIFQFVLPDLTGRVELGPLSPLRTLDRPVFLPLECVYSDAAREYESRFDVPTPVLIQ